MQYISCLERNSKLFHT